jgi:hypothetical protein
MMMAKVRTVLGRVQVPVPNTVKLVPEWPVLEAFVSRAPLLAYLAPNPVNSHDHLNTDRSCPQINHCHP